ncbi:MAG: hypothetical protein IKH52_04340 [Bacteroidaceae bacterium]|nr:hypothetical protein [Bacteroidaceae bacterium]
MQTLCFFSSQTAPTEALKLNEEEIHVRNCIGREEVGIFSINITKATAIKFVFPSYITIYLCHIINDDYSEVSSIPKDTYYQLTENGPYSFKILPDTNNSNTGFEGVITIDDITAVSTFDAMGTNNNNFRGLAIDVNDLIKLSLVNILYLPHGLNGIGRDTILDLTPFENITELYLGQNDETECLYSVELTNKQMEQISVYHVRTQYVPHNIWHLKNSTSIYLYGFPSWRDVNFLSDSEYQKLANWRNTYHIVTALHLQATYRDYAVAEQFKNLYNQTGGDLDPIVYRSDINFH